MADKYKLSEAYPKASTQDRYALEILLNGKPISAFEMLYDYNIACITARVAKIRQHGWPVRVIEVAHPNPKFRDQGKTMAAWLLDVHFLGWVSEHKRHPSYYPGKDGRPDLSRTRNKFNIQGYGDDDEFGYKDD